MWQETDGNYNPDELYENKLHVFDISSEHRLLDAERVNVLAQTWATLPDYPSILFKEYTGRCSAITPESLKDKRFLSVVEISDQLVERGLLMPSRNGDGWGSFSAKMGLQRSRWGIAARSGLAVDKSSPGFASF